MAQQLAQQRQPAPQGGGMGQGGRQGQTKDNPLNFEQATARFEGNK